MSTKWNGEERRSHYCTQIETLAEIRENVVELRGETKNLNTRINGSMDKIAIHLGESEGYRKLIIGTAISLVLSILGGIATASTIAYNLGQYTQQILINTQKIEKLEDQYGKTVSGVGATGGVVNTH